MFFFLNSFAWISFKTGLCDSKKMDAYKNVITVSWVD